MGNNNNNVIFGSVRGTFARTLPKEIKKTLFSEMSGEPSPGHFQKNNNNNNNNNNVIFGSVRGTFARTLPKNNNYNVIFGSVRGTFARTLPRKLKNTIFSEVSG